MTCCAPCIRQVRSSPDQKQGVAQSSKPECAPVVAEIEAHGGPRRGESETRASWLEIWLENAAFLVQWKSEIRFQTDFAYTSAGAAAPKKAGKGSVHSQARL